MAHENHGHYRKQADRDHARRLRDRLASGGDAEQDKAMIKKAIDEHDEQLHGGAKTKLKLKAGGHVEGGAKRKRLDRASGGRIGRKGGHKTVVNIVMPQHDAAAGGQPMPPHPMAPPPGAMAQGAGGPPPGGPPMAGPPVGDGVPAPHKNGGKVKRQKRAYGGPLQQSQFAQQGALGQQMSPGMAPHPMQGGGMFGGPAQGGFGGMFGGPMQGAPQQGGPQGGMFGLLGQGGQTHPGAIDALSNLFGQQGAQPGHGPGVPMGGLGGGQGMFGGPRGGGILGGPQQGGMLGQQAPSPAALQNLFGQQGLGQQALGLGGPQGMQGGPGWMGGGAGQPPGALGGTGWLGQQGALGQQYHPGVSGQPSLQQGPLGQQYNPGATNPLGLQQGALGQSGLPTPAPTGGAMGPVGQAMPPQGGGMMGRPPMMQGGPFMTQNQPFQPGPGAGRPPSGPIMGAKRGGRIPAPDAGGGSGLGRLEKIKEYATKNHGDMEDKPFADKSINKNMTKKSGSK